MNLKLKTKFLLPVLCLVFLISCDKTEILVLESNSAYCDNSHENRLTTTQETGVQTDLLNAQKKTIITVTNH